MTLIEFFDKVREISGWIRDPDTLEIRVSLNGELHCPVTAVATRMTHTDFGPSFFISAGREIGLDENLTKKIAHAADDTIGELRKELLAAASLPPDPPVEERFDDDDDDFEEDDDFEDEDDYDDDEEYEDDLVED